MGPVKSILLAFVLILVSAAGTEGQTPTPKPVRFGADLHPLGRGPWVLFATDSDAILGVLLERKGAEARPTEGPDVVMVLATGADSHALRARIAPITRATEAELAWLGLPPLRLVRGHSGHLQTSSGIDFAKFYCKWTFVVIAENVCAGTVRVRQHSPKGLILDGWVKAPFVDRGTAKCPTHRLPQTQHSVRSCPSQ